MFLLILKATLETLSNTEQNRGKKKQPTTKKQQLFKIERWSNKKCISSQFPPPISSVTQLIFS